jgi:hypothetical protein
MGPLLKRAHCFYPYQTTTLLGQGIRTRLSNNLNNVEQQEQLLFWASAFSFFAGELCGLYELGHPHPFLKQLEQQ